MFELQTALYGDQYAESAQRATLAENEERHYNNLDHTRALGAAIIHFCQYIGANLNGARPQQKALTKLMVAFDHEISGMSLNPEQRHEFVRVVKGEIAGHPENLTNIARFYSYVLEQLEIFNVRVKLPTASDIVTQCIKDRLAPGEMKLKEAERIRQEAVKAGIALCPTKVNDSELITAGFLGLLRGDGGELEEFSSLLLVIRHSWSEGERCAENMPMHLQDALDEYVQSLDEDQARGNPGMLLKTLKKLMRVSSELKHMGYRGLKLIPFAKLVVKKGLLSSANIGETCETFALLVRLIQECKADKSEAKIDTAAVQPLSPSLSTS
jgi:hypothetical protein